jgi:hypothetical protein
MRTWKYIAALFLLGAFIVPAGCRQKAADYGVEVRQALATERREVWAIAPAINLSGQVEVDPLLQADIVFGQLQHVRGLTVVPVNRVAEVYATLRIEQVQSSEQAALVCDLLGCDALVVPTVTAYDPYNPPKLGASLQLFRKPGSFTRPDQIDPRALSRAASPTAGESLPHQADFQQAVGMYDAANGSVREALASYVEGRHEPLGPLGAKEYFVSMERYCGFVYHELIAQLLREQWERQQKEGTL